MIMSVSAYIPTAAYAYHNNTQHYHAVSSLYAGAAEHGGGGWRLSPPLVKVKG